MTAQTPREQLIETALTLFARRGFQAVGIDRLLAEAGVAKMTLYKHFGSKDALILEVLRRRDERWRDWLWRRVEAAGDDPRDRLLAVLDALGEWFGQDDFNGCLFINAAAELGGDEEPVRRLAAAHKQQLLLDLRTLARAAGAGDADTLARLLLLLVEGAIVVAQISDRRDVAADARRAAEILLDAHLVPAVSGQRAGGPA